jgi:hypothetical protein
MAVCRYCGLRDAIRYHRCVHCGTPLGESSPPVAHSWEPSPSSCADVKQRIAALHRKHSALSQERVRVFVIPGHTEDDTEQVDSTLQPEMCLAAPRS